MKKIIVILLLVLSVISCDLFQAFEVTYSVTGGTSADVSYIIEDGTIVKEMVLTPWEYKGYFGLAMSRGISALGDSEITVKLIHNETVIESVTSDKQILIYAY